MTTQTMSRKTVKIVTNILSSAKSVSSHFKLGCAAVKNGKIIAMACNSDSTHPIAANTKYQTIHAEMALITMLRDLSSYDIYVVRWRPTGPGLSAPCIHCREALKKANCNKVFHTINQSWEEMFFNPQIVKLSI